MPVIVWSKITSQCPALTGIVLTTIVSPETHMVLKSPNPELVINVPEGIHVDITANKRIASITIGVEIVKKNSLIVLLASVGASCCTDESV